VRLVDAGHQAVPFRMKPQYRYIKNVSDETIRIGLLFGLMQKVPGKDVYELTPKGSDWLREWCDEQLAIARCMAL